MEGTSAEMLRVLTALDPKRRQNGFTAPTRANLCIYHLLQARYQLLCRQLRNRHQKWKALFLPGEDDCVKQRGADSQKRKASQTSLDLEALRKGKVSLRQVQGRHPGDYQDVLPVRLKAMEAA